MTNLVKLYKWFNDNRDNIIANHEDECVLLKDYAIIGYYPNTETALKAAKESGLSLGDFLIQHCVTEEDDTMIYHGQAVSFGV